MVVQVVVVVQELRAELVVFIWGHTTVMDILVKLVRVITIQI
jgi:hypothetical protein